MSQPDDRLLKLEALTVSAVMITRLETGTFSEHTVIPVTAITVFGGWKLRILEAHYSFEGLVIRKSPILDFSSKDAAIPNIERVMSFMASRKVGNTKGPKILVEPEPFLAMPPRESPETTRTSFRRSTSISNMLRTLTRRGSSSGTTVRRESSQQHTTVRPRPHGRAPIPDFTPYPGPEDPSPLGRFRENVPIVRQSRADEDAPHN